MKIAAYILILIALALAIDASHEQITGKAVALSPSRGIPEKMKANREDNPEEFRRIMSYEWIRAAAFLAGGAFLLSHVLRAEKLDPFAT